VERSAATRSPHKAEGRLDVTVERYAGLITGRGGRGLVSGVVRLLPALHRLLHIPLRLLLGLLLLALGRLHRFSGLILRAVAVGEFWREAEKDEQDAVGDFLHEGSPECTLIEQLRVKVA